MSKVNRVPLLTTMQVFGCVCVIFGHSYPFVTPIPDFLASLQRFVYCFHMPLFVFCSGVLLQISRSAERYSFWQYTKRRSLRLLLPYFVFSLFGIVPKILLSPILNDTLSFNAVDLIRAFFVPRENIWGHFWFLPMIFICGVIGFFLSKFIRKNTFIRWFTLLILAVAVFAPQLSPWFSIDDVIHYLFYYFLGMSLAELYSKDFRINSLFSFLLSMLLIFVSAVLFIVGSNSSCLRYVEPIIACSMIAACSFGLQPFASIVATYKIPLVNRSFSVFIISWPCQLVIELLFERILGFGFWIIMPCMFIVGLIVPCIIIQIVDFFEKNRKRKVFSKIIGG